MNPAEVKYDADDIKDIRLLEEFKAALEKITPNDFMRYQKLLALLHSREYAWSPSATDDRVAIFTERIEIMKYLAEQIPIEKLFGNLYNVIEIGIT